MHCWDVHTWHLPLVERGTREENISLAFLCFSSVFLYCRPQVCGVFFPSLYTICSYPTGGIQVWPDTFIFHYQPQVSSSPTFCGYRVRDGSKSRYSRMAYCPNPRGLMPGTCMGPACPQKRMCRPLPTCLLNCTVLPLPQGEQSLCPSQAPGCRNRTSACTLGCRFWKERDSV